MSNWLTRWFKKKFTTVHVIRVQPISWAHEDGKAWREFLKTPTGVKLTALLDDAIVAACFKQPGEQYLKGMISVRDRIWAYRAPAVTNPDEEETPE